MSSTSGSSCGIAAGASSTTTPVSGRNGACRRRRSRTGWRVVGDSSDGYPGIPGWGAKSAAAVLSRYGHLDDIPAKASTWEVPGIGGSRAMTLAASLRDHWTEALLYRDLARLRSADDGVHIRQRDAEDLRWDGVPRPNGRRSARNGASTVSDRGPTAGSPRAEPILRLSRSGHGAVRCHDQSSLAPGITVVCNVSRSVTEICRSLPPTLVEAITWRPSGDRT